MQKEELLSGARAVFDGYPNVEKVIATSDGQYFLPEAKNHAMNHCRATGSVTFEIARIEAMPAEEQEQLPDDELNEEPVEVVSENSETQQEPETAEPTPPAKPKKKSKE